MSSERIFNTSLWKSSLAPQNKDLFVREREELRSAFLKFRKNASYLVSNIAGELKGLTQHEISHLDALWETASLIAGNNYPLNALEGFVLGGAFLLHDSALCFEAYKGGLDAIRDTTTWKDAYWAARESNSSLSEEELKASADFTALRYLHAEQSASLIGQSWLDPTSNQPLFLIEDFSLSKHLGQLIGEISASHHWDIEKVAMTFSTQSNSLPGYPRDWRIDPLKLACLLRCADASHIDNERAPDFLYALIRKQGISFNHWQAQNKMASVDLDQNDPNGNTIVFTSTQSFNEAESDSWWIAYDAMCVVDKEIKACNALIESGSGITPTFKVKRVKGVESPELMTKYLKVSGWAPCGAKLHVGNLEKLVENLGGKQLYASDTYEFGIVIRELIQNARDAVQARKIFDVNYNGKILIKAYHSNGHRWLVIEDDGIGMSERVLTGPLLDFGTSFWTSSLAQSEFPGLRSSKFRPVGKYGIGFYSAFMIANEVHITSRLWKEGISDAKQLHFKNGLSFRPLFKKGPTNNFNSSSSTQIVLKLKPDICFLNSDLKIEVVRNTAYSKNIFVDISDYLAPICAGLDVSVFFSDSNKQEILIHESILSENFNKSRWLKNISFAKYQLEHVTEYIDANIDRVKPIIENDKILGLAAISTFHKQEVNFLDRRTVGGLVDFFTNNMGSDFIGFVDYQSRSAKRDSNTYSASINSMKVWGEEQLEILKKTKLTSIERYIAACSLCSFNIDPIEIGSVLITYRKNKIFLTFDQIIDILKVTDIAIFTSSTLQHAETLISDFHIDEYASIIPLRNSGFLNLRFNGNKPALDNSLVDCINRTILNHGTSPKWRTEQTVVKNRLGEPMSALIVSIKS